MGKSGNLNVAFRVDASSEIGTGHVMRCLTLANALKQQGAETTFICRHLTTQMKILLDDSGHAVKMLMSTKVQKYKQHNDPSLDHAAWLGVSQDLDVAETLHFLLDARWDWLVVDHYAIDYRWECKVREQNIKLLVIDDLYDRRHQCDIFLNQNIVKNSGIVYSEKLLDASIKLIGPQFALLRKEFLLAREFSLASDRDFKSLNVLLFFGGIDVDNVTGKTIDALSGLGDNVTSVAVIVGSSHPCLEDIKKKCVKYGYKIHVQTHEMAKLMLEADVCIGAGGSTTWERCCLGLPAIVMSLADNQTELSLAASDLGLINYLGKSNEINSSKIKESFLCFISDRKRIEKMSKKALATVDGKGCDRVISTMDALL